MLFFFLFIFFVCFVSFLSKIFLINLFSKNFSSSYVRTYRYLLFSSHSHLFIRGFLNSVFFFFFRAIFWGMWRVFFYFISFYLGAVNRNMRGFLVLEFSFCSRVSPVLCTGTQFHFSYYATLFSLRYAHRPRKLPQTIGFLCSNFAILEYFLCNMYDDAA